MSPEEEALAMKRARFYQIIGELPPLKDVKMKKRDDMYVVVYGMDHMLADRRNEIVALATELGIRLAWDVQHFMTGERTTVTSHAQAMHWAAEMDAQYWREKRDLVKAAAAVKREATLEVKRKIAAKEKKKRDLGYARIPMFSEIQIENGITVAKDGEEHADFPDPVEVVA
jgi:hypothetical protein